MKRLGNFLLIVMLLGYISCTGDGSTTQNDGEAPSDTASNGQTAPDEPENTAPAVTRPSCDLEGKILDENSFWAKTENLLVTIAAVEETLDDELGESHRMLIVYSGNDCQQVFREALPVNISPDYPYYLSDIIYNNVSQVIAVRGFDQIFIFDLENLRLSEKLDPQYLNERFVDDASSGYIQRLEVWESYLIGYATGMGPFVFDLIEPMSPKAVMPAAEFEMVEGTDYHSMFFLRSSMQDNGYQAILPAFDMNTGDFDVNALFDKPVQLQTNINRSFRNNRFLVLKELLGGDESRPVGIDMKEMKKVTIPPDISNKKDTEIISWMKQQ